MSPEIAAGTQGSYHLLGARLSWDFLDDRMQLALWGENLTDEAFFDDAFSVVAAFGSVQRWYQAPRSFGAELTYRWR